MARRRRRARKGRRESKSFGSMISKAVPWLLGGGALIQQVTQKDVSSAGSAFSSMQPMQKGQFIGADLLYRFTGINLAPSTLTNPGPWGLNPAGVLNKWTGAGIATAAYGALAPKGFPLKALAKKAGTAMAVGGIVGGFFDNPPAGKTGIANTNNSVNYSQLTGRNTGGGTLP